MKLKHGLLASLLVIMTSTAVQANPCSKPIYNIETQAVLYGKKGKPMPVKAFIGTGAQFSVIDSALAKHLDWHHRPVETVYQMGADFKGRKILLSGPFRLKNVFKLGKFTIANRDQLAYPIMMAPTNLSHLLVRVNSNLKTCSMNRVLSLKEKVFLPSYHNAVHIPIQAPIATEVPYSLLNEKLAEHLGYLNRQTIIGKMPVEDQGSELRDVIKIPIVLKGTKQEVIFAVIPDLKPDIIIGRKALTSWFVDIP